MQVYASPPRHFRARCRFAVNRGPDGRFHYYLWNGADNCPTLLADDYPAATLGIYNLMPRLLELVEGDAVLSSGLRPPHLAKERARRRRELLQRAGRAKTRRRIHRRVATRQRVSRRSGPGRSSAKRLRLRPLLHFDPPLGQLHEGHALVRGDQELRPARILAAHQ